MSKNVRFTFSVQKIDRHKIIYKDLKNFLHHALILKLPDFLQKKSLGFLKLDIFEMSILQYTETFLFLL